MEIVELFYSYNLTFPDTGAYRIDVYYVIEMRCL
jgi:hypothetical protein